MRGWGDSLIFLFVPPFSFGRSGGSRVYAGPLAENTLQERRFHERSRFASCFSPGCHQHMLCLTVFVSSLLSPEALAKVG